MNESATLTITRHNPLPGHDHRKVEINGQHVGFSSLNSDEIRLEKCFKCSRNNYALSIMSGVCCWCGWDANGCGYNPE